MTPLSGLRWLCRQMAWEGFANPALEKAWRLHFNASQLNLDTTACIIAIMMTAVDVPQSVHAARSAPPKQAIYVFIFFITNYIFNGAILWAIHRRRDWYVRHRTSILVAFKLSRISLYCMVMWKAGHVYRMFSPLELPPGRLKAISRAMFLPSVMARFATMWQLPVEDTWLTSGFTVAMALYDNFWRCTSELEAVPAQGARYLAVVEDALAGAARRGLPTPSLASRISGAAALGLTDYGACIAARTTAQIVVGHLLPMCVLVAGEAASRSTFSLTTGFGYTLRPSLAAMIVQNLMLLPFQACFALTVIVLALRCAGA